MELWFLQNIKAVHLCRMVRYTLLLFCPKYDTSFCFLIDLPKKYYNKPLLSNKKMLYFFAKKIRQGIDLLVHFNSCLRPDIQAKIITLICEAQHMHPFSDSFHRAPV